MGDSPSPPAAEGTKGTDASQVVYQIGKNGDVICVIGPTKMKIQVSSEFLKHISPVFRAMLDSPMCEGETFRNKTDECPVDIMLPEDNTRAIHHILLCLYGANPCGTPSPVDMKEIAILANKYDMVSRLRYFGSFWLQHIPVDTTTIPGIESAWNLLVASYLLEGRAPFFIISKKIVASKGSLLKHVKSTHDEVLGLQLGMAIGEVRSTAKSKKLEMGLCLDCFANSTVSFTKRQLQCKKPEWHLE
ncbi:hypothetical protein FGRMN_4669 [Fusarium graminum]|nr:hypothetical protein FGRMN_4669 [Fusarium graminum]